MLAVLNLWSSITRICHRVTLLLCLIPEEDAKVKVQLEQANKALSRELEEVKNNLSQTEETLKTVEEQRTIYHDHMIKTSNTLMSTVKGLLGVLKKVAYFLTGYITHKSL